MTALLERPPGGRALGRAAAAPGADPAATDLWPRTTRVLPWSLAGFLVMLWVVPFDAVSLPIPLPLDAKLDRPLLAGLALLWLASLLVVTGVARPRLRLTGLHAAVALFFVLAVASVLLDAGGLAVVGDLSLALKKLVLLVFYVLFFVIVGSVIRPGEVPRFVALLLGLAALTSAATVYEYRSHFNPFYQWWAHVLPVIPPLDLDQIDYTGRLTIFGPMAHPLELALSIGLALPFALGMALHHPERRRRLLGLALTGVLLAGIFATQRKTGLLGSGVALLVLLAYRPRSVRRLLPLGLGLVVMLHVLAPGAIGGLREQLQPQRLSGTSSTQQRADDYQGVSPDIRAHPALGRGYGSYDPMKYRILDNEYLSLLISVGVIGTAAFTLVLLAGMGVAHPLARGRDPVRGPPARAASAAVASFALGAALFDVLAFSHVTYLLFFVLGLVVALRRPERVARAAA